MSHARHHGRYPYSPIAERPVYDWPGGKRLAVYIGLNLEWFRSAKGSAPNWRRQVRNRTS
jgi:allantoinase